MNYKILGSDQIIIREDGVQIPADLRNADYREYLDWLSKGNTAEVEVAVDASADELRKQEYNKRGVTIEKMIVALWEFQVEGRSQAIDELQAIREQVKEDIPIKFR